ncbi:MAG TPA: hypothetical protein VJR05_15670 [Acidimicrobiia bacterium]|nr:hypothetical protein [Acidimicrobiia bacterium]
MVWSLIGSLYVASPFLLVVLGWWQEPFSELGGSDRVSHRVHEVLFGLIFAQAMVGAVSQLRHRLQWSAGIWQTVLTLAGFVATLAFIGRWEPLGWIFLALGLGALLLHPAGRGLWKDWHPRPVLLVIAGLGLSPWVSLASENLVKAGNQAADHLTHWGGVAAFAVIQALLGLLAALRPPGYRLVAGSLGVSGLAYVLASTLFSFDASAKPGGFVFWLLLWSLTWLTVAVRTDSAVASLLPLVGAVASGLVVLALGGPVVGALAGLALTAFLVTGLRSAILPRPLRRGLAMAGVLVLMGAVAVALETHASNIPHGLPIDFAAADSATCLGCHATSARGATLIPHEIDRTCDDPETCWDGRVDCMGCHRYDPSLRQALFDPLPPRQVFVVGGSPLTTGHLDSLINHGH